MSNFETRTGVVIAIFAAFMAVSDLFAGKYGDDEIIGTNDKANAYQWYQSKSIKESLIEGEIALLTTLSETGAITEKASGSVKTHIEKLAKKVEKYQKEKKEILLGSNAVGKENWVQDIDGEFGKIIGAKEIEAKLESLGMAGDKFDMASLFYQISLVVGAIALILKNEKVQTFFFWGMVGLGSLGAVFSVWAFKIVGLI